MGLESFRIEDQKAIRLAECQEVPPIMVITGPNGVGKSTLLYCLKRRQGGQIVMSGEDLYIPPHRTWRRHKIRAPQLLGKSQRYSDALHSESLSVPEGLRVLDRERTQDSADEAISFVKYTLIQLDMRRRIAIAEKHEKSRLVEREGTVLEVFRPLTELTKIFLPHLEFSRIDVSDRENVQCLWKRSFGPA